MASNLSVRKIKFKEIDLLGVVGKGAYGTVRKGKWLNQDVAVKFIETEQELSSMREVLQLSRVDHENIIKLYAICKAPVCLVLEYAEGGSLDYVLHSCAVKDVKYTASHALSWLLQTAKGVAYLHNMKPRSLLHRDLKPANLLLVNSGTVIKICDFGTVRDKQSYMTENRGSIAWMAPEVVKGCQYSEKCDVFSWSIILWEVLTRKIPYLGLKGIFPYCVMMAVLKGKRPPLIQGCPKAIENLMTRCWAQIPSVRPSMNEVQNKLSNICRFMKGADDPIIFLPKQETSVTVGKTRTNSPEQGKNETSDSDSKTVPFDTNSETSDSVFLDVVTTSEKYTKDMKKHRSADFCVPEVKFLQSFERQRSNSLDSPRLKTRRPESINLNEIFAEPDPCIPRSERRRSNSLDSPRLKTRPPESINLNEFFAEPDPCIPRNERQRSNSLDSPHLKTRPPESINLNEIFAEPDPCIPRNVETESSNDPGVGDSWLHLLEPQLRPLPPIQCPESIEIYKKHVNVAHELCHYRNEISKLQERKKELLAELQARDQSSTYFDEWYHLKKEKDSLLEFRQHLRHQLEVIRTERGDNIVRIGGDELVVVEPTEE